MDNTRRNGLIVFFGILVVAGFACVWLPFFGLPGAGIGMALPIITVPGEVVVEGGFFGLPLTNTIIGMLAADVLLLMFAFLAWRSTKGWTNRVPTRFQVLVEILVGGLYNFLKGVGGERLRTAPLLWPLAATIFFFLLTANLMKLLPGYESVGYAHCSHVGFNGYPMRQGDWSSNSYVLYVDSALNAGVPQSEETEHICHEFFQAKKDGQSLKFEAGTPATVEADIAAARLTLEEAEAELTAFEAEHEGVGLTEEQQEERHALEVHVTEAERALEFQELRLEGAVAYAAAAERLEDVNAELETLEASHEETAASTEEDHGEEAAAAEDASAEAGEPVGGEPGPQAVDTGEEPVGVDAESQIETLTAERAALQEEADLAYTRMYYPGAVFALSQEEIDGGTIYPYIFHITPFFRGAATDLNLTFGLAIMVMIAVQVYGVLAQGPAYFEKFVNISALGNLGKRPLGAIDFVVGLIEIISEIGKIISLAFRLFGNLFAGGVALLAISFLVSLLVPGIIYLLEIIIGSVQALVFSVLLVVFAAQAMESHHGEHAEEGHHGEHGDEGYYDPNMLEPGKPVSPAGHSS